MVRRARRLGMALLVAAAILPPAASGAATISDGKFRVAAEADADRISQRVVTIDGNPPDGNGVPVSGLFDVSANLLTPIPSLDSTDGDLHASVSGSASAAATNEADGSLKIRFTGSTSVSTVNTTPSQTDTAAGNAALELAFTPHRRSTDSVPSLGSTTTTTH